MSDYRNIPYSSLEDLDNRPNITMINQEAPNFDAQIVDVNNQIENINLKDYVDGRHAILFFYPLNFTFVCPTEILSLSNLMPQFENRNTVVLGISVDSVHSHLAWKNTPYEKAGIGNIQFPLVSDLNKEICEIYGTLDYESGISYRATVIIDPDFKVIHHSTNANNIGRNIEEYMRIVDASQHCRESGEVCPVNWAPNTPGMKPNTNEVTKFILDMLDDTSAK